MPQVNFCVEHQTVWFKKGTMKGFAHPIKDENGNSIGWCNKPKDAPQLPPPTTPREPLPEHQEVIDKAVKSTTGKDTVPEKSTNVPKMGTNVPKMDAIDPRKESIEHQTAIKEIGEDWRAGKLNDDHPLVLGRKLWLTKVMGEEISYSWQTELIDLASKLDQATRDKMFATLRDKTKGK